MRGHAQIFERELLGSPTRVMRRFLAHFETDTRQFIKDIAMAARVWEQFGAVAKRREQQQKELMFSSAYFLNAINAALVSTRLLLSGYIVPAGNQARYAVESLAFGVLLVFPATGAYRDWKKGHEVEYKALDLLARNARHCGVDKKDVEKLKAQIKCYDKYSHPSGVALKSIWIPPCQQYPNGVWNIGAVFVEGDLEEYRREVENRLRLAQLIAHTIAGTHAELIKQGKIDCPMGSENTLQPQADVQT